MVECQEDCFLRNCPLACQMIIKTKQKYLMLTLLEKLLKVKKILVYEVIILLNILYAKYTFLFCFFGWVGVFVIYYAIYYLLPLISKLSVIVH